MRASLGMALAICMALLLAPGAPGLGISPARIVMDPSGTEFTFRSIPSQGEDGTITVRAEGDLAHSITFEKATLQPGEEIKGMIAIPPDLAPGPHQQDIIITSRAGEGTVGGRAEVAAALIIQVPYPEEYLAADWSISRDNGNALITVTLQNLGSKVTAPQVTVTIADDIVSFDETPMAPGSFSKLESTYLPGERQPGVYTAELLVEYAGERIVKTREEAFGQPTITLDAIEYSDETGAIKPIDISGTLGWNRPLEATLAIHLDGSPAPALKEIFTADGAFERRIYLDTAKTGIPQQSITAIVTAAGAEASGTQPLRTAPQDAFPWWIAIAVIAIIVVSTAILLLRRKAQGL